MSDLEEKSMGVNNILFSNITKTYALIYVCIVPQGKKNIKEAKDTLEV